MEKDESVITRPAALPSRGMRRRKVTFSPEALFVARREASGDIVKLVIIRKLLFFFHIFILNACY